MIDRWLNGEPLAGFEMDDALPVVDKTKVLARQVGYAHSTAPGIRVRLGHRFATSPRSSRR